MSQAIEAVRTRLPIISDHSADRSIRGASGRLGRFENMDDETFVVWAYENVLRRDADAAGLSRWVGDLGTEKISREDVLLIMLTSDEFVDEHASLGAEFVPTGHFYSAVPSDEDRRWALEGDRVNAPVVDVDLRPDAQKQLISDLAPLADEFSSPATDVLAEDEGVRYYYENSAMGVGDGLLLYSMIRHLAPKRIIEVGCGYSSALMLDTNEKHFDGAIDLTFIEPYPELLHALMLDGDQDRCTLKPVAVQDVDLAIFDSLEAGDILFIDSTHVSKLGSDVNRLIFDVLPRLAPGVVIHIHDIDWAFGYPDQWVREGRAWNESYLVRAFLAYNSAFEIMAWGPYLHAEHREFMDVQMPMAATERGNSLWIQRTS